MQNFRSVSSTQYLAILLKDKNILNHHVKFLHQVLMLREHVPTLLTQRQDGTLSINRLLS